MVLWDSFGGSYNKESGSIDQLKVVWFPIWKEDGMFLSRLVVTLVEVVGLWADIVGSALSLHTFGCVLLVWVVIGF